MKPLILLLLIPVLSFSQPPKKTNEIHVKEVSYSIVAIALLDAGYKIEKSDKEFGTLRTEKMPLKKNSHEYLILDIRIKDSTAIITGKCGFEGQERYFGKDSDSEVSNIGAKGSQIKEAFLLMEKFALSLGKEVIYLKI